MATIKDSYAAASAITITLGSLANSTAGVGRQGTLVDNTTNLYIGAEISVNIKMGTSPTNNSLVYVYLVRSNNDSTAIIDDGAGTTDAGLTVINAPLLGVLNTGGAAATGQNLKANFDTRFLGALGPKWTVAIVNSSGVALDSTNGNHVVSFVGITQTVA